MLTAEEDRPLQNDNVTNRITIDFDDKIRWNNDQITISQLATLLHELQVVEPPPILEFKPHANAGYELSARVLRALISSRTSFRIVEMEKYCSFSGDPRTGWVESEKYGRYRSELPPHFYELENWAPHPDDEECEPRIAINSFD